MDVRRALARVPLLAALGGPLAGCGTFAQSYDPAGVDQLAIPLASPVAHDFVGAVDNRWLPLRDGATRRYSVARPGDPAAATRTVTVLPGRVEVDGVTTTAVRSTLGSAPATTDAAAAAAQTTDYYAQDTRGNVWWFGHVTPGDGAGTWRAGEQGAEAGLAMAAEPRVGDGYRTAYLPGVVEDIATVVEIDGDTVQVDIRSTLTPGGVTREIYQRGTGLVTRIDAATGEYDELER